MCGISAEIAWQLFFLILDPFWPTFGHFTSSGRYGLYRGARPKGLSKNLKFHRKSRKVKKIELTIKMCGISPGIPWQLFFRFWTRFDSLLAILLLLGGTASIGEPDQKDLAKIWNLTEKSPKVKKNRTYHQNVRNFVRNPVATFFFAVAPVLTHFWPFY